MHFEHGFQPGTPLFGGLLGMGVGGWVGVVVGWVVGSSGVVALVVGSVGSGVVGVLPGVVVSNEQGIVTFLQMSGVLS